MSCHRIAIGTVQFGLAYGVANQSGQVPRDEAASILSLARRSGCDTLDTAVAYGESEARLGEIGVEGWRIITKLPPIPDTVTDPRTWARATLQQSLARIGVSRVHGVMLHRAADLLGAHGDALAETLIETRDDGLTNRIGVSVYDPAELEQVRSRLEIDVVQAPFNVLDRRLVDSGWAARLHEDGVEIHARSAFLQGLLLMDDVRRPPRFSRFGEVWRAWREWLAREAVTPLEACIGFVLAHPTIDRVVVGVDSATQLQDVLAAAARPPLMPPDTLRSEDPLLLNPSMWNTL